MCEHSTVCPSDCVGNGCYYGILGDPEVTANIYCNASRNLSNTDTQNDSTDLR